MSTKHTPGPWGRDQYGTIKAKGKTLRVNGVSMPCGGKPSDFDEVEANTRLIAAAPELLDALEAIIESVDAGSCAMLTHLQWAARAAITKATGGEQ